MAHVPRKGKLYWFANPANSLPEENMLFIVFDEREEYSCHVLKGVGSIAYRVGTNFPIGYYSSFIFYPADKKNE